MSSSALAALLAALLGSILAVPLAVPLASPLHAQASFSSAWSSQPARHWIGSEYWGNRSQDWRIHQGRVECLTSSPRRPVRVLHLLTIEAASRKAGFDSEEVEDAAKMAHGSLRGFLIGSGGPGIDYRITALAHSRPAEDGGMVAGLDAIGRLVFRDFNHNEAPGGWGIGGKLRPGEFAEIEAARRGGAALSAEQRADTVLRVSVQSARTGYRIRLSAQDPASGEEICFAELDGQSADLVEGSFGLVSHPGSEGGAGGRKARRQDDGGYTMPARFVRMVERTQTSHLPDAFDPRPVKQGNGVYYTSLDYGGMSFAILEDRKFKDSPTPTVPDGRFKNGWAQAEDFDARKADVPGAQLLGQRQLDFLAAWARDCHKGKRMKVALSQTIFANVATIPLGAKSGSASAGRKILAADRYPSGWKKAADGDSNGWPQTGRNKALRLLRKAFAAHVAGDQHLASLITYGVDDYKDAGVALCVPSIANTWPRRWWPAEPGLGWKEGQPRYTGSYLDGWGNHMTVHAVANPSLTGKEPTRLHDRAPGYGIVRFDKKALKQRFECWPRWAKPGAPDSDQYPGWPRTFDVADNYGRKPLAWLPEMKISGLSDPLVEIVEAETGTHVYSVRMKGSTVRPWTFAPGQYRVHIGEPGTPQWKDLGNLEASAKQHAKLNLSFVTTSRHRPAKPPNIIFIMADDLGYRELGSYGQKKIKTPHLDQLAREGMRFTRHYAGSPVCAPSRCVLLTGMHPGHAEIRDNGEVKPEGQSPISAKIPTIASLLKAQGYVTGAFGKWGLGYPGSEGDPLKKGFDRFFGYNCQRHAHSYYPDYLWDDDKRIPLDNVPKVPGHAKLRKTEDPTDPKSYARFIGKDFSSDRIAEQVMRFVKDNKDKSFFLYYPTIIPHLALQVPEDSVAPYRALGWEDPPHRAAYTPSFTPRATYAGMITRMDSYVGRLMALLEELGLDQNTVVIFTSDNGATYLGPMAKFFDSVGELRGLKGRSYEGGLRVPAIVRWPGKIKAGSQTDALSGFEDWMPTLLDLVGASDGLPANIDGRSILPTLLGTKQDPRPFLYREFAGYGGQQAGWIGRWKAIRTKLHRRISPMELYDLSQDAGEKNNVAKEHPEIVARFKTLFEREHTASKRFPLKALDLQETKKQD